jgi:MFS family permease
MAYSIGTLGVALLLSVRPGAPVGLLYVYGLVYGLCYGASAVLLPVLSADMFQGRNYGSILGGIYIGGGLGSALGAFLGGYVFDVTGAYTHAFALIFPGMWLSCLAYWLAGPRKVRLVAGRARKLLLERAEARPSPEG